MAARTIFSLSTVMLLPSSAQSPNSQTKSSHHLHRSSKTFFPTHPARSTILNQAYFLASFRLIPRFAAIPFSRSPWFSPRTLLFGNKSLPWEILTGSPGFHLLSPPLTPPDAMASGGMLGLTAAAAVPSESLLPVAQLFDATVKPDPVALEERL